MEENQEHSKISELLKLKQYEQPEEAFFDEFLQDFKARQRTELIQVSARSLFVERLLTFFKQRNAFQWAGVSALACIAIALVIASQLTGSDDVSLASSTVVEDHKSDAVVHSAKEASSDSLAITVSSIETSADVEFAFIDLNKHISSEDVEF